MKLKIAQSVPDSESSVEFHQGMVDRMGFSFFKYGAVADAPAKFDNIKSLKKRLENYEQDGNTEWLMDVANFAMIEFMKPKHKQAHFRATNSDESPGRVLTNGKLTAAANTAAHTSEHDARKTYKRDGD